MPLTLLEFPGWLEFNPWRSGLKALRFSAAPGGARRRSGGSGRLLPRPAGPIATAPQQPVHPGGLSIHASSPERPNGGMAQGVGTPG